MIALLYILIDSDVISELLTLVGCCPECVKSGIVFSNYFEKKKGLANCINLACNNCKWTHSTYTSRSIEKSATPGMNAFDVNVRSVIAFREIGKGISAMQALCGYMNLVSPMQPVAYNNIQKDLAKIYKTVANTSMIKAADILKETSSDIPVSCDGSWQKQGFSSLNGLVTVISVDSGKCLDFRVKTKNCRACSLWESRKGSDEYIHLIKNHACSINHEGSSGSMESDALVDIFKSSETFNGFRYVEFLGDGDTKSHHDVVASDPYPGTVVKKLECIGHVPKRVGNRLRRLKTSYKVPRSKEVDKNKKKKDNSEDDISKAIAKLTHKQINKLQNYYGIAVRQFTGTSVYESKKSIDAVLYHSSEADSDEKQHEMCPQTAD